MLLAISLALAVSPRFTYEAAYDNVAGGDWYRDSDNEMASLAWGESYVMMSLASMFRATGDLTYLERLDYHLQGVYAQRDDQRGAKDWKGRSGPCWQSTHYTDGTPYCWLVHDGMIVYPMAEFARLVAVSGLADETAADDETFGVKADRWASRAAETVAWHDAEFDGAVGAYRYPSDASFLPTPGDVVPLNQGNAMGRALLALSDATDNLAAHNKATQLASYFRNTIAFTGGAAYWEYRGESYSAPGEDISHASINIGFATMAADRGIVFSAADIAAMAGAFYTIYDGENLFADYLGDSTHASTLRKWGNGCRCRPMRPSSMARYARTTSAINPPTR